ncbi:MAG: hypothetical protein HKN03_05680 [Acidimicrobiales bacterium]|nr:hypothetical protein [Acidimicrobiales bacterium]
MMNLYNKRFPRRFALIGTAFVAAALFGMAVSVSAAPGSSYHGTFSETADGHDLGYDIHGSAKMTVGSTHTAVKVNIAGLDPATVYTSHLHNGTCASGGGGHYQNEVGPWVTPPNELWLTTNGANLVPNNGGVAHGHGFAPWVARTSSPSPSTNALSVIVHAPPRGARIACADLQ